MLCYVIFWRLNLLVCVWVYIFARHNMRKRTFSHVPNKDSNQTAHLHSLISLHCLHEEILHHWLSKICAQWRFWSDRTNASSDLNHYWADMSEGMFSDAGALILFAYCLTGGVAIDGDEPEHIKWILDKSLERASEFNITGITYRLTQGRWFWKKMYIY